MISSISNNTNSYISTDNKKTDNNFALFFSAREEEREALKEEKAKEIEASAWKEEFFDEVREAGGMAAYLNKLNAEKIEKLIEERRQELEKIYKVNDPSLSVEEKVEAARALEKDLQAFIKDLMKKLEIQAKGVMGTNQPLSEILKDF